MTTYLLPRVVNPDAAAKRRRNYQTLLHGLPGRVAAPFDKLPDGASPFVFPLDTSEKERLLRLLASQGIHAFDFWSVGHQSLNAERFSAVEERRRRTVGLPVHQELRPRDVARITTIVAEALSTERQ